jgi:CubicO group peptidase (beta-lactamase class C family)
MAPPEARPGPGGAVLASAARSLPSRPSLRYLKLEAKRRLSAGEFSALYEAQLAVAREHGQPSWKALKKLIDGQAEDSHVLPHLRWVAFRFRDVGAPGWMAPGPSELRRHFSDELLGRIPPDELIATLTGMAADLRDDYVVTARAPLAARVKFADLQLLAAVEADPPHRVTRVRRFPLGSRITGARGAASAPRAVGDVPTAAREIAAGAVAELGLPGLVLAGGGPDTPEWAIAEGWADLDRHEVLTSAHRFPACRVTRLITATAVLRLVADGKMSLNDPVTGHQRPCCPADRSLTVGELLTQTGKIAASGYAALGQLIANVTGSPYPDATARLVLEPLGMSESSFPRSWPAAPDAVTGYQVNRDIAFTQAPARVYAIQADGGMWTTAADLVRFGTGWSSLLPGDLAREALQPQAATGPGGLRIGLGWPIGQHGDLAGMFGGCPGASASLLVRVRAPRGCPMTYVALTNRQFPIVDVNVRLVRTCGRRLT